jgi:cation diffusion facilitator CzcD-associated flavoprotein CzcO
VVPDADLFKAIRKQKAEVVTDQIERFTEKGILLRSGSELEADIIVTATGLVLKLLGGMTVSLNGKAVVSSERHVYRGVMLSDQPNFAIAIGYTNASWTLKCELSCKFVARILDHMEKNGLKTCTPRFDHSTFTDERLLDFEAGYVKRADDMLPKQGSAAPWKVHQNYLKDTLSLKFGTVTDRFLEYR